MKGPLPNATPESGRQLALGAPAQRVADALSCSIDGVVRVTSAGTDMQAASVRDGDDDRADSLGSVSRARRRQRNVDVAHHVAEPSQAREEPILGIGSGLAAKRAADIGYRDSHVMSKATV
jgi:hypothetical protein